MITAEGSLFVNAWATTINLEVKQPVMVRLQGGGNREVMGPGQRAQLPRYVEYANGLSRSGTW